MCLEGPANHSRAETVYEGGRRRKREKNGQTWMRSLFFYSVYHSAHIRHCRYRLIYDDKFNVQNCNEGVTDSRKRGADKTEVKNEGQHLGVCCLLFLRNNLFVI